MAGKNYKREIAYIRTGDLEKASRMVDIQIRQARVFKHETEKLNQLLTNHHLVLIAAERCLKRKDAKGAVINLSNAEAYLKKAKYTTKRLYEEEKIA